MSDSRPERLYLLDLLRGLASLSVVVWHYQHFYFVGTDWTPAGFDRAAQPFYGALSLLYEQGWRAVELFFVLSGFVFFYQYAEVIRSGAVGAKAFFVLRFSRLYPLHAVTLVIVALGQWASVSIDGQFVVYPCNDATHFLLNALFISYWMPAFCLSFNGPTWSVSAEVLLYALFFAFAVNLPRRWGAQIAATLLMIGAGLTLLGLPVHRFAQPVIGFFAGGLAYLLWDRLPRTRPACAGAVAALAVLGASAVWIIGYGGADLLLSAITFPALILFLAFLQSLRHDLGRRARVIGDITYSTYLLHFPLQLGLIVLVKAGWAAIDYSRLTTWLAFFALLFVISVPTYYRFERPAQMALRGWLLRQHTVRLLPWPGR